MAIIFKSNHQRWLVISDLQIPFEHEGALAFCHQLKQDFKIPQDNILCVGDEVDQYFGSLYRHDPDALHSPCTEIMETRDKIKQWSSKFPKVKFAVSNHGLRWAKKAFDAQIPSQMIKPYQEIIGAPKGWVWKYSWKIKAKYPFQMIHGTGYSGHTAHRLAAMDAGMSTVIGHLHSHAGISHVKTSNLSQNYPMWKY